MGRNTYPNCLVHDPRFLCSICYATLAGKLEIGTRSRGTVTHLSCGNCEYDGFFRRVYCFLPSSDIKSEVFPEPVCPTMRLIAPRLKISSPVMLSLKRRRGVSAPSSSRSQAKVPSRMPSTEGSSPDVMPGCVLCAFSAKWSKSSVCRNVIGWPDEFD